MSQNYDLVKSVGEECISDAELLNLISKKPGIMQIRSSDEKIVMCPSEAKSCIESRVRHALPGGWVSKTRPYACSMYLLVDR